MPFFFLIPSGSCALFLPQKGAIAAREPSFSGSLISQAGCHQSALPAVKVKPVKKGAAAIRFRKLPIGQISVERDKFSRSGHTLRVFADEVIALAVYEGIFERLGVDRSRLPAFGVVHF